MENYPKITPVTPSYLEHWTGLQEGQQIKSMAALPGIKPVHETVHTNSYPTNN